MWLIDFCSGLISGLLVFAVISTMSVTLYWAIAVALFAGCAAMLLTNGVRMTARGGR
jgi:hypothetical protein